MARPTLEIDPDKIRILAMRDCNRKEMAATLDVSYATLRRRFDDHQRSQGSECVPTCSACIFELAETRGREQGNATLRTKLYDIAARGNTAALIFLAKNRLGYTDKQEVTDKRSESLVEVIARLANMGLDEIQRRRQQILSAAQTQQLTAPVLDGAKPEPAKKKGQKA